MYLLCSDQDAKLSLLTVSFTEIKFKIFVESVAKQPAILTIKIGFLKCSRKLSFKKPTLGFAAPKALQIPKLVS